MSDEDPRDEDPPWGGDWIDDYLAMAVPEGLDPDLLIAEGKPTPEMLAIIQRVTMAQYTGYRKPVALLMEVDALVTDEVSDVEDFQPAHDCDVCHAGNTRARKFLQDNPGQSIVLANLRYQEVWM